MDFHAKLLVWLTLVLVTCFDVSSSEDAVQYRLPNDTSPIHYDIRIETQLEEDGFRFSGICEITLKVLESTSEIVLHSKLAKVQEVTVRHPYYTNITTKFSQNASNDLLIITMRYTVSIGYVLNVTISYLSELRTDNLGFYRLFYTEGHDTKKWLAVTQFAPTEARHAFPCYDEPNRKATFKIVIRHPSLLQAVSNTDIDRTVRHDDGTTTTLFKNTKNISTYQVGFMIGEFETTTLTEKDITYEMYEVRHKNFDYNSSLHFASDLFEALSKHLQVSFPVRYETFRQVALPDFYYTAIENWAFVIYREMLFAYKQGCHSESDKIRTIATIGHEMAHSWFGNLVTMDWWTYVWLNEGFTTLYAYYGAQIAYPNYKFMELFLVQITQPALKFDGSTATRKMSNYVEKQVDIMKSYDKISYEKAACVLRMWEHAFGRQYFQRAVIQYLKENQFRNVNEGNLTRAFAQHMPEFLENATQSWTSQKGYPVLTVIRDYKTLSITLFQERFMNLGEVDKVSLWHIPINFAIENRKNNFEETTAEFWMDTRTLKLSKTVDPKEWIIFNKQQSGFYRVNYDEKNWELITQALRSNLTSVHVLNRAQLIDDAFALASAEKLNYTIPLRLIQYMSEEESYAPWGTLRSRFLELKRYLHGTTSYTSLLKYIAKFAEKRIQKENGTFDPTSMTRLTYEIVFDFVCEYDTSNCPVDHRMMQHTPGLRPVYYCNRMKLREKNAYLEIRNRLRREEDSKVRRDLVFALGCASNELVLSIVLHSSIEVPSSLWLTEAERELLLRSIYRSGSIGLNRTMQFISTEWRAIEHVLPGSLNTIIADLAKYVNTQQLKQMFKRMVSNIDVKADVLTTANVEITNNLRWNLIFRHEVDAFFNSGSNHCLSLWALVLLLLKFMIMTML